MKTDPIDLPTSAVIHLIHYQNSFVKEGGDFANMYLKIDGNGNDIYNLISAAIEKDPEFRRLVNDAITKYNNKHK